MFAWKKVTYNDDCSLAGAKMLQRYRTNISGSSRKGSLHRLESLFLIDEDDKEDPDEDTLEVEEQVLLKLFSSSEKRFCTTSLASRSKTKMYSFHPTEATAGSWHWAPSSLSSSLLGLSSLTGSYLTAFSWNTKAPLSHRQHGSQ